MPKAAVEALMTSAKVFDLVDVLRRAANAAAARYGACYAFTLQWEGGYVNHPDDPGGCTNKGITIGTYRDWHDDQSLTCSDLKGITEMEVAMIYGEGYWSPVWGNDLPVGLNLQVWDWGVNSGPSRAVRYLQQMVSSAADGIMGPNTLTAVNAYVETAGIEQAIKNYAAIRQDYYEGLSTWPTFGDGWTNRNEACESEGIRIARLGPWHPDIEIPDVKPPSSDLESRVVKLEKWAEGFKA